MGSEPTPRRRLRPGAVIRAAAVLAVLAVAALGPARAASAALGDSVLCAGTNADTFTPGITDQPQLVQAQWHDTYSGCVSSDKTLTAGSDAASAQETISCLTLPTISPFVLVVTWDNGQSSTITLTLNPDINAAGQTVNTGVGTVTAGEFTGDTATAQFVDAQLNPAQCLTQQGVTSQSGTSTLQILGL
jgi:hypothetical protein